MKNNLTNKNIKNFNQESLDWTIVQSQMKNKLGNEVYESWLKKINFVEAFNNYIILTVPKTKNKSLDFSIELDSQISFPVAAGTKIGQLKVNIPNESSEYFDIYSTNELKRTNIFSRFFSYIYQSIVNLFVPKVPA